MVGAPLAHVDAFGIAPAHLDDRRGHQAVVQHHVGLLHQAQGPEGQQIRITRACPYQIHLAALLHRGAFDHGLQQPLGLGTLPGQLALGDRALEYGFPETPALVDVRIQRFDLVAKPRSEPR